MTISQSLLEVTNKGNTVQVKERRCINTNNINSFVEALRTRDWSSLYLSHDVNSAYKHFISSVYNEDFNNKTTAVV